MAERIVRKVTLHLEPERQRSATLVTHAIIPYVERTSSPHIPSPSSSSSTAPAASLSPPPAYVYATLRLSTRSMLPHELASNCAGEHRDSAESGRTIRVLLADGGAVVCKASVLASHSSVLRMLIGSHVQEEVEERQDSIPQQGWREAQTGEVPLLDFSAEVVRGMLQWMDAASGAHKRQVAAELISPELVVEVARLSHFLDCQPLLQAAVVAIGGALSVDNAPSCLLLARELDEYALEQKAAQFIIQQLESVQQHAEYWVDLPASTRALLMGLRDATLGIPMQTNKSEISEPRELLGMLRESLAAQVERLEAARARELEQPVRTPNWETIEMQAARVRKLEIYLQQQENIFVQLLNGRDANMLHNIATGAKFTPTYEWQTLAEATAAVPPGLEVEMPLDGRPRRVRIPPRWTLRVWMGFDLGYWRYHTVERHTTVLELRQAAAQFAEKPLENVSLQLAGAALADDQTADSLSLFSRAAALECILA